jgi:hypothetical protein
VAKRSTLAIIPNRTFTVECGSETVAWFSRDGALTQFETSALPQDELIKVLKLALEDLEDNPNG